MYRAVQQTNRCTALFKNRIRMFDQSAIANVFVVTYMCQISLQADSKEELRKQTGDVTLIR